MSGDSGDWKARASGSGARGSAEGHEVPRVFGGIGVEVRAAAELQERIPEDWVRRPWGVKQKVILSCRSTEPAPLVYLTQNGDCLHIGCNCRPMQFAGTPIQRALCNRCFPQGALEFRRGLEAPIGLIEQCVSRNQGILSMMPRSARLSRRQEVLFRRLCKFCRWGS